MDEIISQLIEERTRASAAVDSLRGLRDQAAARQPQLEHPGAVLDHIDFFLDLFGRGSAALDRIAAEMPDGLSRPHIDQIHQLAGDSAVAQRRQVQFRGKWINKPLPHEAVRALLNVISLTIHEQLDAFRELAGVASELESSLPPREQRPVARETTAGDSTDEAEAGEARGFNRRALFTRLFKPDA